MKYPALRLIAVLGASALILGSAPSALGQNRVFASARSGNDLNTCGNIATPCQTLQGAVNQVAAGGNVLILDTGGYGPVTIGKAVTIEAPTGVEAFIHPPAGNAITIQAGGTDVVVLRGLTLSVGTIGIDYLSGAAVHVERCVIQGFPIGIAALNQGGTPFFGDLYVEDTTIRNCANGAIDLSSAAGLIRSTVERCHLVANGDVGLDGEENTRTVAWNTVAAGNRVGFLLTARNFHSSSMFLEQCTADDNEAGVLAQGSIFDSPATLWISNSTVTGNGIGVIQRDTSQVFSRTNNTVEGNAPDTSGSIGTYLPR